MIRKEEIYLVKVGRLFFISQFKNVIIILKITLHVLKIIIKDCTLRSLRLNDNTEKSFGRNPHN